ncbi:MAG TPA: hypothetical protein VJW20_19955, partial [Candidatus Angelobacter sp.]|nr:hypothetical protein [Candidatus Angelobacter sp.]
MIRTLLKAEEIDYMQVLPAAQKSHSILRTIIAVLLTATFALSPLNDVHPIKIQFSWHLMRFGCVPLTERPLRVGISHWAGFAGGILANGGVQSSSDSPKRWGNNDGVKFIYLENTESREQAFSGCADDGNHVDVLWTTVDSWAAEYPLLARDKDS